MRGAEETVVVASPQGYLLPTALAARGSEPHDVFVTGGMLPDTLVIAFTGQAFGDSAFSWSWLGPGGTTGARCTASTSCGFGGGPVAVPPGVAKFAGDPQVVTDRLGDAVFVQQAKAADDVVRFVTASISLNGGRTIANTVIVNENNCTGGRQDQPTAAFDTTVSPPELWVAWRHNGSGGTYGLCVRHGTLDLARSRVAWAPSPRGLDEAMPVAVPTDGIGYGVGGIIIQAGDGAATIVNAGSDQYLGTPTGCPRARGTFAENWYSTTTWDDGRTWVPNTTPIAHSDNVPRCSAGGRLSPSIRNFGFVRDDGGDYYVAVHDAAGQISVYQSQSQGLTWRLGVGIALPAGTAEVFFPTLASAAAGHVGLSFYATDPSNAQAAVFMTATHNGRDLGAWETAVRVSGFMPIGPANPTALADYMGLAAYPMASCTSPAPPSQSGPAAATSYYVPTWTDRTRLTEVYFAEPAYAVVARVPPP